LDDAGFESRQGQEIFLFFKTSRLALRPTQLSSEMVLGLITVVELPESEFTSLSHPMPTLRMS
jgi:hypothetical protein